MALSPNPFASLSGSDQMASIEELEEQIKVLKQSLLKPTSPAMASSPAMGSFRSNSDRNSFPGTTVAKRQTISHWQPRNGSLPATVLRTRNEAVRLKIDALRASSSTKHPICFRCAEKGHFAQQCRNAVLCFVCNRLGHRSDRCRSVTDLPPAPRKHPPSHRPPPAPSVSAKPPSLSSRDFPALPPPLLPLPSNPASTPAAMSSKAMKAPIRTLYVTEDSEALEQQFQRSFFLTDEPGWGAVRIEQALKKLVRHFNWIAARFDETRYLIEAPSPHWLENVLNRGSVMLDNIVFKVAPWDPCYTEGLRMIPSWIRIRGFPMKFWKWEEFEGIFADFGATVLELDPATRFKRDWRFARVRVGLCDPLLLPAVHWVMHRDAHGFLACFDLIFELEHQHDTGAGPWKSKKPVDLMKRKLSGDNTGISIADQAPPRPAPALGNGQQQVTGKGKDPAPTDETLTLSDSDADDDDMPPPSPPPGMATGSRAAPSARQLERGSSSGLPPTPAPFHPSTLPI